MGHVPPTSSDATPVRSNNGEAMNVDTAGLSRWQEQLAPRDSAAADQNVVNDQNVVK